MAPLVPLVAPELDQLGGGIERAQVGAKTAAYVEYFGDATEGATTELTKKRLDNYTDVVNSCACASAGACGA
jgi:hypothetical protein